MKSGSENDLDNFDLSKVFIDKSPGGSLKSVGHFLRNEGHGIQFVKSDDLSKIVTEKYMGFHSIGAVFNPLRNNEKQTSDFVYLDNTHFDACIFHQKSTPTALMQMSGNERTSN